MRPDQLPRRLDDLRGLRAARWVRESQAKQGDKYGPGAQRSMQDQAIDRYGLVDTGLSWMVLKSGWSGADSMDDPPATKTPDFRAMLQAAENGAFDVLLVGYTSRFLRDVQLTLHYRRFFHRNGVVILICDDRILTSDPNDWERLVDKVKADEQYSRTLGRNIRTGLQEKRRSKGDPGGQPPLGYRRQDLLLAVDDSTMPTVNRAFELSAAGQPDHEVAAALGLTIHTVRHVLTNPIYVGRLSDGSPFHLGASVAMPVWNLAHARREARRTRVPGIAQRRCYALRLTCSGCGAALQGHNDRYRHADPACDAFRAAQPATGAVRGRHWPIAGTSYPKEWYEALVEALLDLASLVDEGAIQRVIAELNAQRGDLVDRVTLARVARARSEALRRLDETRDVVSWQATVTRLDAEEAAARAPSDARERLSELEIRAYLANLGDLWRSADDAHRQSIALALFDRMAATGFRELAYEWSASAVAYGLDRIVAATIEVDLAGLGLKGAPEGMATLRRLDMDEGAVVLRPAV